MLINPLRRSTQRVKKGKSAPNKAGWLSFSVVWFRFRFLQTSVISPYYVSVVSRWDVQPGPRIPPHDLTEAAWSHYHSSSWKRTFLLCWCVSPSLLRPSPRGYHTSLTPLALVTSCWAGSCTSCLSPPLDIADIPRDPVLDLLLWFHLRLLALKAFKPDLLPPWPLTWIPSSLLGISLPPPVPPSNTEQFTSGSLLTSLLMITILGLETHTLLTPLPLCISSGTLSYWFSLLSSKGLIYSLPNTPCAFPLLVFYLPLSLPRQASQLLIERLPERVPAPPVKSAPTWAVLCQAFHFWVLARADFLSFRDTRFWCRVLEIIYCYPVSLISRLLMCLLDCKFLEDRNHILKYCGTVQSAYTDQTLKTAGWFVCMGFVWW